MNKRFLFLLVLLVGVIGIGLVLWFVLRPVLPFGNTPAQQPPTLPDQVEVPFNPANTAPKPPTSTGTVDASSPEERERQAQAALNRQALDFGARQGTYSTADGFDSLREVEATVTASLQAELEDRRAQLLRDHPSFGTAWSQTTRTLSSAIETSSLPLGDRTEAAVVVQAQRIVEDAKTGQTTELVAVRIQFVKINDAWVPSDVTVQPLAP